MDESRDLINPGALNLEGNIEEVIEHILENVRLTRNEVENLDHLFNDLKNTLNKYWPGCNVIPFGSIVTGLGITSSDVDCYVSLPEYIRDSDKKCVQKCRSFLNRQHMFQKIFSITNAKVPIVKFYHVPTQRNCDVSFNSLAGVRNSSLIGFLMNSHPIILKLTVFFKYWSKVHKLTGTNRVPNYALTVMVVFYLQYLHILPPIYVLQEKVPPYFVDGWNTAFPQSLHPLLHINDSMHQLIGRFFEYYASFDYENNVMSPYLGKCLNKKLFEDVARLPSNFTQYKKILSENCMPLKLDTSIVVQDPFQHNRNCCVAVYPKLAAKLISYFQYGARMYKEKSSSEFLKSILLHAPFIEHVDKRPKKLPFKNKINKQQRSLENVKMLRKNIKKAFNIHYGRIYMI